VYKNKAACLKFDHNVLNIKQFVDSPHPYYLPNFMDVFQWSLPFVAEKVTDMLAQVLHSEDSGSEPDESDPNGTAAAAAAAGKDPKSARMGVVAAKWKSAVQRAAPVSRMLRMYKILRQDAEAIIQLKQLTPNHKVPFGLIRKGSAAIREGTHTAHRTPHSTPHTAQHCIAQPFND
jgi:serine/threonine-protein phosphatase 2B catalytic subunit